MGGWIGSVPDLGAVGSCEGGVEAEGEVGVGVGDGRGEVDAVRQIDARRGHSRGRGVRGHEKGERREQHSRGERCWRSHHGWEEKENELGDG